MTGCFAEVTQTPWSLTTNPRAILLLVAARVVRTAKSDLDPWVGSYLRFPVATWLDFELGSSRTAGCMVRVGFLEVHREALLVVLALA